MPPWRTVLKSNPWIRTAARVGQLKKESYLNWGSAVYVSDGSDCRAGPTSCRRSGAARQFQYGWIDWLDFSGVPAICTAMHRVWAECRDRVPKGEGDRRDSRIAQSTYSENQGCSASIRSDPEPEDRQPNPRMNFKGGPCTLVTKF